MLLTTAKKWEERTPNYNRTVLLLLMMLVMEGQLRLDLASDLKRLRDLGLEVRDLLLLCCHLLLLQIYHVAHSGELSLEVALFLRSRGT